MPGAQSQGGGSAPGELQFCVSGVRGRIREAWILVSGVGGSVRGGWECVSGVRGRACRAGNEGAPKRKMSQIFHSVFITFCFCRSEGCENLPQICYSPKVEDLGHFPLALSATGKLGARPARPPGSFSNTRHTCHNPPGLLATVGCIFRELSAPWEGATTNANARSYTHSKAGGRSTSGENPV